MDVSVQTWTPTPGPGCVNRRFVGTRKVPESNARHKTRNNMHPRGGAQVRQGLWEAYGHDPAPFARRSFLKPVRAPGGKC